MNFSPIQRGVLGGMAVGAMVSITLVAVGVALDPFDLASAEALPQRLRVAAMASILLASCLAFSVGRMARHRFLTPADIDGGGLHSNTGQAAMLQALLQNTLEQSVLAALSYITWVATMPAASLSVVPLAALAFGLGRILFFSRYEKGAAARATGFALTFYPSVAMLLYNVVFLLWSGNSLPMSSQ